MSVAVQTLGCTANLQTRKPAQTSVCSQTVARFRGSAARCCCATGRTRRPCGSTVVLVGQIDDVDVAVAQRLQGRCSENITCIGREIRCDTTACVALRDATILRCTTIPKPLLSRDLLAAEEHDHRSGKDTLELEKCFIDFRGVLRCDVSACAALRHLTSCCGIASTMRGGWPLSCTTISVSACRQRRQAVGLEQCCASQIARHGT